MTINILFGMNNIITVHSSYVIIPDDNPCFDLTLISVIIYFGIV
jgi:hypothetical protein